MRDFEKTRQQQQSNEVLPTHLEGDDDGDIVPGKRQLIVGMSTNSDEFTRQMALGSGMDAFLEKPVRIEVLTEIVRETLQT